MKSVYSQGNLRRASFSIVMVSFTLCIFLIGIMSKSRSGHRGALMSRIVSEKGMSSEAKAWLKVCQAEEKKNQNKNSVFTL
jgi:hypothetical protein